MRLALGNAGVNSVFVYRNGAFSFSPFQHLLACYTLYKLFIYNVLYFLFIII